MTDNGDKTPGSIPPAMQNYLSNIRARIHNNPRMRIGGNGMDNSTYKRDQKEMIVFTNSSTSSDNVPVDFGPVFFKVLNAMADKVGEMQFIIGLSMQHPDNDSNVIDLATDTVHVLGQRLDSMLLGNVRVAFCVA